jgi:hypothetical protein
MTRCVISLAIVATLGALAVDTVRAQPAAADPRVVSANSPDSPAEVRLARIFRNGADQRLLSAEVRNRGDVALTALVVRMVRVADGNVKQMQGRQVAVSIAPAAEDLITIQLSDPPFPIDEGDRVVILVAETSGFGGRAWRIDPAKVRTLVLDAAAAAGGRGAVQ